MNSKLFDVHVDSTVQLNLNFTHACRYKRVLARLTLAKLDKLACARTVACNFGMRTQDSKHTQHTRDACHKLTFGLPHYTYGVTTGTVAVAMKDNCLQLIGFIICHNEHRLIILLKRHGHTEHSRIFLCR